MAYLSNVGKIDALSKESKIPTPVGEAAAASSDSADQYPQQQKLIKKQLQLRKIPRDHDNCSGKVNHCNLSTEDFLKLHAC